MSSLQLETYQSIRIKSHIGLLSAILFAGLTGLSAFLVIPLPFTPVPITGQTFLALLSGFVLGKRYGPLSQGLYILLGIIGIPWFAEGTSGISILLGATGGYLVGFVIASYLIGYITDLSHKFRKPIVILFLTGIGTLVIYMCGIISLMLTLGLPFWDTLQIGFFPFIPGDILKVVLVFLTASFVLPQGVSSTDRGLSTPTRKVILGGSLLVSIVTVTIFIIYMLNSGSTPPVNLAAFSILTSIITLPSLIFVFQGDFLTTSDME